MDSDASTVIIHQGAWEIKHPFHFYEVKFVFVFIAFCTD